MLGLEGVLTIQEDTNCVTVCGLLYYVMMQRSWPLYPVVYSKSEPKLGTFKIESPDMTKHELKATCMTHENFQSLCPSLARFVCMFVNTQLAGQDFLCKQDYIYVYIYVQKGKWSNENRAFGKSANRKD